jgi:PAS domain S-box-containing protein
MSESNERFQVLFENNPHPTWVYDLETLQFLEVNRAALEKYGYSREEFLGMRIIDIRPAEDVGPLLDSLKKGRADLQSSQRRYSCKDGSVIPVAVTSHLALLNGRRVSVVVAEDITERLHAQEVLVKSKEEAERTTRFKDRFLSTMSHELRTPLNAILGFSELLCDERYGSLNERQRRYIEHIHTGGRHLLQLINEILDLSKIEAGRFELAIETVPIQTSFGEVLSVMRPLADRKSQTLSQRNETGLHVRADATRLKQVLMNLVGNGIKFTPEGGHVELLARRRDDRVQIEVRDTGPGIPFEEQERIFEAFYRLQKSGEATEGTGLGLAITQRIVEMHGGKLALESQPGQGSCFYFSLPVDRDACDPADRTTEWEPKVDESPRVLVIEDDPVAWQLIQSQLVSSGYQAVHCSEPERAAEMAANLCPDAITLDLLMKPINGWEVLAGLKREQRTAKIPVIVVTIVDQPPVGAILGADEYLVKPVEKPALLAAVKRCLGEPKSPPSARPILVVEDDAPTREIISELLTTQGYNVAMAADGAQARDSVAASLPQIVILDLMLPKLSGLELISEWRANARTADLSVLVLTSKDLSREEEKYLRSNAEFLFRKQQPWQAALMQRLQRIAPQPQPESVL